jgi:hypothetical protein
MVPVAPIITGLTLVFTYNLHALYLCYKVIISSSNGIIIIISIRIRISFNIIRSCCILNYIYRPLRKGTCVY